MRSVQICSVCYCISTTVLISTESNIPASETSHHDQQDLLPSPVPGTSRQDDSPSTSVPENSRHDIQPVAKTKKRRRQNNDDDVWNSYLHIQIDQANSVIELNKSKKTLVDLQVRKLQFDMGLIQSADVNITG